MARTRSEVSGRPSSSKHAVASGLGPGDQAAGPLDDLLGGLLRLADMFEFLGILAAAVGDADAHVAFDADARLADQIGEDQRQSAIGHHPRHARAAKAFGRRLGRGRLAVAGKTGGRSKVARGRPLRRHGRSGGPAPSRCRGESGSTSPPPSAVGSCT